jgi:hypothetical protein
VTVVTGSETFLRLADPFLAGARFIMQFSPNRLGLTSVRFVMKGSSQAFNDFGNHAEWAAAPPVHTTFSLSSARSRT